VISEQTHEIFLDERAGVSSTVVLHDMEIIHEDRRGIDLDLDGARLEEAFLSVWRGETDNDSYNRLVTNAGLSVREATVLRAYARYLRQAGIAYSQEYIALSLNRHSDIAAKLFELFRIRFDVALKEAKRTEQSASVIEAIETALAEVPSLDDDRILRRYVNAIESSLRTNYFQTGADGAPRPALAFKLDPKKLEGLPDRDRSGRSLSMVRKSRVFTCVSAPLPAAVCAGPIGPRITARKCSAWSRRSRSRTPSSCRLVPRAVSIPRNCPPKVAATRFSRPGATPTSFSSAPCCR
jgi:NAD-specific glutamate dehydrogenase